MDRDTMNEIRERFASRKMCEIRTELDQYDWTDIWPVVDRDGCLTGEFSEGDEPGVVHVDCHDDGTVTVLPADHGGSDAVCSRSDIADV